MAERRVKTMRRNDHETTSSAHDIPSVRHEATPPPDASSENGAAGNPDGASDTGERSSQSQDIQRARVVAQAAPEVRRAKVEAARRALQEGTLTLDGQALAAKLLQAVRPERCHP
jgi:flagellar biosynthesis anti-sigma factor FlgM